MTSDLLLGALLSIPIGIITGLAVTPIQRWYDDRGKVKSVERTKRLATEYETVLFYRDNPHIFTQYLAQVAIKTTFIGSTVGIVAGIIYGATNLIDLSSISIGHHFVSLLYFIAQMVVTMSSILIVRICNPALALWGRIRNFDGYVATIPAEIRSVKAGAKAAQSA